MLTSKCYTLLACMFMQILANAQNEKYDTLYIEDHSHNLTVRVTAGNVFLGYKLGQRGFGNALVYKSNDNFNLGAGFNYKFVGITISFKAPFVNNDQMRFGKTEKINLQTHIYQRKYTLDIYGQYTKGYYTRSKDILKEPVKFEDVILRPDLQTTSIGINAHYIFNNRRFSYRASFIQNEYQKKSAGSLIGGGGVHYFNIKADSSLIPADVKLGFFNDYKFNRSRIICVAVNMGYAHTIIIKRHYFLTGALIGGVGFDVSSLEHEKDMTEIAKINLQLNGLLRVAVGYNWTKYIVSIQFLDYIIKNYSPVSNSWQQLESGSFRVTLSRRFYVNRHKINNYKQ